MKLKRTVFGIVLGLLVIYQGDGRPHPESDCVPAPYAAWALVRQGTLDLRSFPELRGDVGAAIRQTADNRWVSRYPVGSTLAMLPVVAPVASFQQAPLSVNGMQVLGKLAASLSVAWAAVLLFLICREIAPSARWPATILFSLGTCLCSVASQAMWMHGPATFWLTLALWWLLKPETDPRPCFLIGLALGMATITRPTTALFALATGGTLVLQRRWGEAARVTFGGVIPVALLCLINQQQFGSPLLGGYAEEYGIEPPPWRVGLGGLLIAPSRGVLVYTPALLLAPFGIWALVRGRSVRDARGGLIFAWLIAAGATLVYYARWHDWRGGWCFGPRFLCETMPVLCLAFAIAFDQLRRNWQRVVAWTLVGLSVAVHFIGLFGYGAGYVAWHQRHERNDHWECLFELEDTQIEAQLRHLLRRRPGG